MDLAASSLASSRVFAIPELLENILIQIIEPDTASIAKHAAAIRALFRLLRVNTKFKVVILTWKTLCHAMYLIPSDDSNETPRRQSINPLLIHFSKLAGFSLTPEFRWYPIRSEMHGEPHLYAEIDTNWQPHNVPTIREIWSEESNVKSGTWCHTMLCNLPKKLNFQLHVTWDSKRVEEMVAIGGDLREGWSLGELVWVVLKRLEGVRKSAYEQSFVRMRDTPNIFAGSTAGDEDDDHGDRGNLGMDVTDDEGGPSATVPYGSGDVQSASRSGFDSDGDERVSR